MRSDRSASADYVVSRRGDVVVAWSAESESAVAEDVDAATVIQAAIDRASSDGGGRVLVASGEYRIDRSITPKSGVALLGSGPGRTVLVGTPALEQGGTGSQGRPRRSIMQNLSPMRDVVIEGFEFDGSEMYRPTDPDEYHPARKAIHSWYATRFVIRNNYVHDTPATGIGNDFNVQCRVVGNVVEDCGTVGDFNDVPEDIPGSNGIGIGIGDETRPENPTVIANNAVSGSANNNILLEGFPGELTRNFVIANNLVYEGRHTGIRVDEARDFVVSSNTVLDNALHGVLVTEVEFTDAGVAARDGVVADNLVAGNGGNGIDVPYPGAERLSVTGNLVRENGGDGVRLRSAGPASVVGNTVADNGRDGVRVSPAEAAAAVNVGSNTVSGNAATGITVDGMEAPVSGLSVVGNQVAADGRQEAGISLEGAVREALVATNGVTGDHGEPLRDDADGEDVLVELNLA